MGGVHLLINIVEQGLIFALVVMAVFLTSRVIKFDDLTVEGSFGFGGAVASQLVLAGLGGWVTLPASLAAGAAAGLMTGLLHTKMRVNNLISGLVVTTGLFSVSLKVAGSNVALPAGGTLFDLLPGGSSLVIIAVITLLVWASLQMLLRSEVGLLLHAVGGSPQMVTTLGKSVHGYKILGLVIANAITALAGALFIQWIGFFSITANVGTLIVGLAGLILGEVVRPGFGIGPIIGAILYQGIFATTVELQLDPVWNNLIKALLIVALIQLKTKQAQVQTQR